MRNKPKEICDQVVELRDIIDDADLHSMLSTTEWHVFCAAMDTIEDTQQAIEAFTARSSRTQAKRRSTGERYLRTYGVLQALAVQQEALENLCDSLSAPNLWDPSPVEQVNELRIVSVGHPTLRRKTKTRLQASHFIVQISLDDQGFELMSFDSAGQMTMQTVSIPTLAKIQSAHISATLEKVLDHIPTQWPH